MTLPRFGGGANQGGEKWTNQSTYYYNRNTGEAPYKTTAVRSLAVGTTNLTVIPERGERDTVEIEVKSSITGSGSFTKLGSGEGRFNFSIPNASIVVGISFYAANNMASNNWTYYSPAISGSSISVRVARQDGSKSGYPSGKIVIYKEDGTIYSCTSVVSGTI